MLKQRKSLFRFIPSLLLVIMLTFISPVSMILSSPSKNGGPKNALPPQAQSQNHTQGETPAEAKRLDHANNGKNTETKDNTVNMTHPQKKESPPEVLEIPLPLSNEPTEEFLVQFKPGTPAETKRSINANNKVQEKDFISGINVHILATPPGKSAAEFIQVYQRNPNVIFAEPNFTATTQVLPNDTYYPSQRGLHNVNPLGAWEITVGCTSVPIAVLDTGIDYNHLDLAERVIAGYDFINNREDAIDDRGHGTQVAGIIGAATNNVLGMAGTTWTNPLLPVKVLNSSGSGTYSGVAQGVIYAADNGARVINMSLGGTSPSLTLEQALQYAYDKGVILVAAAGNNGGSVMYPAAYSTVIAVGAVDDSDLHASFSSYGPELSVVAPGVLVWSTRMGGSLDDYTRGSGTSFAAPFVAGLAGLILSINPDLTPDQVQDLIQQGSDDLGTKGWNPYYGWGRINLSNTLALVEDQPPPKDTTPPAVEILSPSDGAVIEEGSVTIQVVAEDESGIAKIELLINGVSTYTATGTTTLLYPWDTTDLPEGTYTLEAVAWDKADNYSASDPVVVEIPGDTKEPIPVTGVQIAEGNQTVTVGDAVQLTALIEPGDADNKEITWATSNRAIAVVSDVGLVQGLSEGVAVISVVTADGGFTDGVEVTVEPELEPEPDSPRSEYKEETHTGSVGHRNQPQQLSYQFDAIGGVMEINLSWSPWRSNLGLYLYDSGGNLVAKADANSGRDATQYISVPVNAETYTIVVKSITNQGNFTLVITNKN